MNALGWIVRKDLLRFAADRTGALTTLVLPLVLATLLSLLLAPALGPLEVELLVVDHDRADPRTAALIDALDARDAVRIERVDDEAEVRARVADGTAAVAMILPPGTGAALGPRGLTAAQPPRVELLYDPSRGAEIDLAAGVLLEVALAEVLVALSREGGPSLRAPLAIERRAVTGTVTPAPFDIHAHLFAGMLSMFVLFMAQEQARHLVSERAGGTLMRLRLSGAPRWQILLGTGLSTALLALVLSAAIYATGMLLFGFGVRGSPAGFALVLVAQAVFAGAFALLLAGLARSERQLVNAGTAAVLLMSFAGGSWLPAFLLPRWLDTVGHALPTWWANRGLAAMTWRGHGVEHAWLPAGALLALALLCGGAGMLAFRWTSRSRS